MGSKNKPFVRLFSTKRRTIPPSPPVVTYTAAYVNNLIGANAAAASGTSALDPKVVTLPAGRYILEAPIRVPNGAKHLVIEGAGVGLTIFERTTGIATNSPVVGIGNFNWFVSGTEINVENVTKGDTTLTKKTGQSSPTVGGFYVLRTARTVKHRDNGTTVAIERELVKIDSVVGSTIAPIFAGSPSGIDATLSHTGACRTYNHNNDASINSTTVTENVTIKNLTIDAASAQEGLSLGTCWDCTIQNVEVKRFGLSGIQTWVCNDVLIDNCDVNSASAGGPGAGYGIDLRYTHNAIVQNCDIRKGVGGMRHAVILHSGSTDILIKDCTSDGGSYDTHGMNEQRIHFLRCNKAADANPGRVGCDIGNGAYLYGAEDVRIEDCDMRLTLGLHAGVTGVTVVNGNFSRLLLEYSEDLSEPVGVPSTGQVGTATFTGTTFNGTNSGFSHLFHFFSDQFKMLFGSLTFTNCTFNQPSTTNTHRFFDSSSTTATSQISIEGDLTFDTCTFNRTGAASPQRLFRFAPGNYDFNITFDSCTINSTNQQYAIWLDTANNLGASPWLSGTVSVTDSTFASGGVASAAIIFNSFGGAPPTVVNTGNTVT